VKDELLWSLVGGLAATVFNVLYNYVREARNRRWRIASEIVGEMDFYYQRLVTAMAHLEAVFDDKCAALSAEEWRQIQTDVQPLLIDQQRMLAKVDIVYGVESYESNQLSAVFDLLKEHLATALSTSTEQQWHENSPALREGVNQLARIRPEYRKRLVEKARIWPIFNSPIR
jgi:hypothetical protein